MRISYFQAENSLMVMHKFKRVRKQACPTNAVMAYQDKPHRRPRRSINVVYDNALYALHAITEVFSGD